ncbi:hypothetical protein CACET_c08960 [Clostridium aceticum]|uniref:Uncharacterized protein n=1 Tax=Clostridium aceticum TaxID=84022 RepID=A0A0D8IE78_9CLOT|nr:DUF5305 domain-containing protein [Clostridium aceticum]AKL94404.1 hypothetical protein CACET_c08960 [Clostridium aceticum]KJF28369.1 hypothetical protein TZ02_03115 [Clostridium aceticum]
MKKSLNRSLRVSFIIIFIILIGIMSFSLYGKISYVEFSEEQIPRYSYKNKTDVSYEVFLKPNLLFDEESLGEDHTYFTEFIDHIQTTFNYGFYGEAVVSIEGDYEVLATIEGYNRETEGEKIIWKKDFIILPVNSFAVKDQKIFIEEDISFILEGYNKFADQVAEAAKTRTSTRLIIYMKVNLKANTEEGLIEEQKSPAIVIPLGESQVVIEKRQIGETEKNIEETIQVELPLGKKNLVLHGIFIGICLIGLIYVIFFTSNKPPKNKLEKTLNNIFKKHGSRLVALEEEKINPHDSYYKVKTIEDLVKIADEIEKPILYKHSLNPENITKFYIIDKTCMYVFDLRHLVKSSKENVVEEVENSETEI